MTEDKALGKKRFEDLLATRSVEDQKKALEATSIKSFAEAIGKSEEEALDAWHDREEFFSEKPETETHTNLEEKHEKENEHKAEPNHEQHGFHPIEQAEENPSDTEGTQQQAIEASTLPPAENQIANLETASEAVPNSVPNSIPAETISTIPKTPPPTSLQSQPRGPMLPIIGGIPHVPNPLGSPVTFPGIPGMRRRNSPGIKSAGKTAVKEGAKKVAKRGAVVVAQFAMTPWGITIITVTILAIVLFFVISAQICQFTANPLRPILAPDLEAFCAPTSTNSQIPPPPVGVIIDKQAIGAAADGTIDNGDSITYTITITYDPRLAQIPTENMVLVDNPDYDYDEIGSGTTNGYNQTGNRIEWSLGDHIDASPDSNGEIKTYTFRLTLTPTEKDIVISNSVWIETTGETPNSPNAPEECNDDPAICLRREFNFIAEGNYNNAQLRDVYSLYSEVAVSPRYKNLLTSGALVHLVFENSADGGCPATVRTSASGRIDFTLKNYSLTRCTKATRKTRLIHESGHIIKSKHPGLYQDFISSAYNRDNGCYNTYSSFTRPYFIKTYSQGSIDFARREGVNLAGENETFAEFVALYVMPQGRYPKACPTGYNFIKERIYNNYEF